MRARALVGWNLRRIRNDRDISQEALAHEAGVDRAYVGGIERKSHNPTIDLLERLAITLNIDISELFAKIPKGATPPKPLRAGRKPPSKVRRKKQ